MSEDPLKKGAEMAKNLPAPALFQRPADVLALDATFFAPFYRSNGKGTIKSVQLVAGVTVALANTVLTLTRYRNGTGAVVASKSSGSLTAAIPVTLSGLTNPALQEGDLLSLSVTKSGAGLILPALAMIVTIEAG
jgi:hypothetical protein